MGFLKHLSEKYSEVQGITTDFLKLKGYLAHLKTINLAIDALDKFDRDGGYGDMAKNFEDADGNRITKRLYDLVRNDMTSAKQEKIFTTGIN